MDDSSTGRHGLDFVAVQNVMLSRTVPVAQTAFKHVGDDFHIPMRMRPKALAPLNAIVIEHAQDAEAHVLRIIVVGKGKRKVRLQPAPVGPAPVFASSNGDHDSAYVNAVAAVDA